MSTVGLLVPGVGMGGSPAGVAPIPSGINRGLEIRDPSDDSRVISFRNRGAAGGTDLIFISGSHERGAASMRLRRGGTILEWRAPGDPEFGGPVAFVAGGTTTLRAAGNENAVVDVQTHDGFLFDADSVEIELDEVFSNAIAHTDVDEFGASGGTVDDYEVDIYNASDEIAYQVRPFFDPASTLLVDMSFSALGPFSHPTDYASGLDFASIAPGARKVLYLRRTIPAASGYDPAIRTHVRVGYQSI